MHGEEQRLIRSGHLGWTHLPQLNAWAMEEKVVSLEVLDERVTLPFELGREQEKLVLAVARLRPFF